MREQDHGQYKFLISDDMDIHYKGLRNAKFHMNQMEFMFTKRKLFRELFEAWGGANNLAGFKLLEAHGDYYKGEWIYSENHKVVGTVQDWVKQNDGSAIALMITSCNPYRSKLSSEHSLALHTGRLVPALPSMIYTQGLIRVFVPGMGYMEKDYKGLRKLIDNLK
jgi:hypothetical protein